MENKVYAVKKTHTNKDVKYEWWAVIDCGTTKKGGMCTGRFWQSHFKKNGRTYRWFRKLILVPDYIKEWDEIKVKEELICRIVENDNELNILEFEGWDDTEDGALASLQAFAELLGHNLSFDDVRKLINSDETI